VHAIVRFKTGENNMEMTKKELAELILKFGDHKPHCNYREHLMYGCSCGWNKAVDAAMAIAFSNPESKESNASLTLAGKDVA